MLVKGVVELGAEYKVDALSDFCVLRDRKVHVLVVGSSEAKNARACARVSKHSHAAQARPGWLEGSEGFKRSYVKERPLCRVEIIGVLQEWLRS